MAFTDELLNNASERVTYVTIKPRFNILDPTDTLYATGVRYINWPFLVTDVSGYYYAGTIPTAGSQEWWYDETTQRLYYSTDGFGSYGTGIVEYILGFTSGSHVNLPYLVTVGSESIPFEARLQSPPRITETIEDQMYGLVSLTASPLEIIHTDGKYKDCFFAKTSWDKVPVNIYMSVNGEVTKLYQGVSGLITQQQGRLSISITSPHTELKQVNSMGIGSDSITCTSTIGVFSDNDSGKAIPYYSSNSREELRPFQAETLLSATTPFPGVLPPNPQVVACAEEDMAINWDYNINEDANDNDNFILGYVYQYHQYHATVGNPYNLSTTCQVNRAFYKYRDPQFDGDGNFTGFLHKVIIRMTSASSTIPIGTTLLFTGLSTYGNVYAVVVAKDASYVWCATSVNFGAIGNITASAVSIVQGPRLSIETPNGLIPLIENVDFTSGKVTVGSIKRIQISFIPDSITFKYIFQLPSIGGDSIRIHKVIDVQSTLIHNVNESIGNVISFAGIPFTDSTGPDITTRLRYRIPKEGSSTEQVQTTLQYLLQSVYGYVRSTISGGLELKYFSIPTTPDYYVTEDDILKNTFSYELTYDDTYTTTYFRNQVSKASYYRKDDFAISLYGKERRTDFDTALYSPLSNTGRMAEMLKIINSRKVKYSFRLSHKFLNLRVGDVLHVTHPDIMESVGYSLGVVTSIAKSELSVSITMLDFKWSSY